MSKAQSTFICCLDNSFLAMIGLINQSAKRTCQYSAISLNQVSHNFSKVAQAMQDPVFHNLFSAQAMQDPVFHNLFSGQA